MAVECPHCGKPFRLNNGKRKLTDTQVRSIRRELSKDEGRSQRELARVHGVSRALIRKIMLGEYRNG